MFINVSSTLVVAQEIVYKQNIHYKLLYSWQESNPGDDETLEYFVHMYLKKEKEITKEADRG